MRGRWSLPIKGVTAGRTEASEAGAAERYDGRLTLDRKAGAARLYFFAGMAALPPLGGPEGALLEEGR